ncbi:hypothetical protein Tco_1145797 [Tanacetum coccineum]
MSLLTPLDIQHSAATQIWGCYNHVDRQPEVTTGDPIMQFVVQNFEQINAMYSAFSSKRKESTSRPLVNEPNEEQPIIEPWQSDSERAPTNPGPKTLKETYELTNRKKKDPSRGHP